MTQLIILYLIPLNVIVYKSGGLLNEAEYKNWTIILDHSNAGIYLSYFIHKDA